MRTILTLAILIWLSPFIATLLFAIAGIISMALGGRHF